MEIKDNKVERFLSKLDSHCVAGDIRPLATTISHFMGPYLLKRFRERKLIYRVPVNYRNDVANCFLSYAEQLGKSEYNSFANYISFSITADLARRQLLSVLHEKIRRIGSCRESEILGLAFVIYESETNRLKKYTTSAALSEGVAHDERRLHDLNGQMVDLSNALARILNETGRLELINENKSLYKRRERKRALSTMRDALTAAGQLNALEWIFDEVSFGHFVVAERGGNGSTFKLDYMDAKVALMRRLATRRSFILKLMNARPDRYVRSVLSQYKEVLLNYALDYYCLVANISELNSEDIQEAQDRIQRSLTIIDAEDDLLFHACKGDYRVQAYYISGLILTCFAIAGEVIRESKRRTGVVIPIMDIPLSIITEGISFGAADPYIAEGLAALCVTLPLRSHSQLNALPFMRDKNDVIRPFLHGYSGMWNTMVRNALIQGGAVGKAVGSTWEEFTEFSFSGSAWQTVGKGIKLKRGGKIVTDVDLLLLREDLLLVIQIKSLIGTADTAHDHWKNRQIAEVGCMQARKSADFLMENPDSLLSICGKKASEKIRIIQPVVFTNIYHMEGFSLFDVPVIGGATRKAICRGSKVDYYSSDGKKIHTHTFVAEEQLDTKEILRLLKEPVELLVACDQPETIYRKDRLGCLELSLPEFADVADPFQPVELENHLALDEQKKGLT
ncbi:hypothetical protein [Pseudoalteromonas tetraodonis]|uniref:hypothetical protein n=1 Tax=Pseudoalteromonas tetraodonis TaxID=43659 RepID=UPI003CFEE72F